MRENANGYDIGITFLRAYASVLNPVTLLCYVSIFQDLIPPRVSRRQTIFLFLLVETLCLRSLEEDGRTSEVRVTTTAIAMAAAGNLFAGLGFNVVVVVVVVVIIFNVYFRLP